MLYAAPTSNRKSNKPNFPMRVFDSLHVTKRVFSSTVSYSLSFIIPISNEIVRKEVDVSIFCGQHFTGINVSIFVNMCSFMSNVVHSFNLSL